MSIEVLLVDEDVDVLEIVGTFLGQEDGFEITTEDDPEAALDLATSGDFDAVVSDYKMPRLDGMELCRALRDNDVDIPFLLFTAREHDDVADAAAEHGVTAVVQKGTGTEQYSVLADRIRDTI
ncbi:response regulator [Haloarcula argentinensis]|uniref:Response regulator n=1 Tax=Haloarcula argentinensis TaxID=43776 RepID=A0A847UFH7_HALAR|nr:response regulator [Haloarcula argentinensis]NLV11999.1 response regulator [Haloarcula argentinensis]